MHPYYPRMTKQQRPLLAVVLLVALVAAGCGSASPSSGAGASPSTSGVPTAVSSGAPSVAPSPPTETPSAAPRSEAPSATATAKPTPKPTPKPGPPATITFTQLKLDAKDDPAGVNRVLTFDSHGTGKISVAVKTLSPMGTVIMCLSAGGVRIACRTTPAGAITVTTTRRTETFKVTLRGEGVETPIVEVTATFPSATPSVTIKNARFDGTDYPETNGIQALVSPRADGNVTLLAAWGGHPFAYEIDLMEQNGGSGSITLANQGPSTNTSESLAVNGMNPWKLLLQNVAGGFGITPLTATIAWP